MSRPWSTRTGAPDAAPRPGRGAAIIGLLIDGAGLIETIAGMGALYVLTVAVMFAIPALRRMDAVASPQVVPEEPVPEAEPALQARLCPTMKGGL